MAMILSAEKHAILKYLLKAETQGAARLLSTLKQEYQHLSQQGASNLDSILNNKQQQLNDLAKADKQLYHFLDGYTVDHNNDSIEKLWIDKSFLPLKSLWEALKPLTRELKQQNEINGLLISQSRANVTAAISVLTGRNKDSEYGRNGLSDSSAYSRSLAKA